MTNKYYKDYFDLEQSDFKYKEYVNEFGRGQYGLLVLLLGILGIFMYFSFTSIMNILDEIQAFFASYAETVEGFVGLLQNYRGDIISLLFIAILTSYITSVLALRVLEGIGAAFLWVLTFLSSLISVFLIVQIRTFIADQSWLFWMLVVFALLPIILLVIFWKNLKIAARLINLTAKMLMQNKRVLINGVIYGLLFLGLTVGLAGIYIDYFIVLTDAEDVLLQIRSTDFSQSMFIILVTAMYYFLVQFTYNFYYGGVIAQAHGFYRGKKIGTSDSFKVMIKRMRAIMVYSAFSTIIYMIQWFLRQLAKRSKDTEKLTKLGIKHKVGGNVMPGIIDKKSLGQRMANWAIKMLEKLWLLINFYTLPAIVIENMPARKAIKRSANFVRTKIANLYIRKTAVRHIFRFTTVLMLFLSGGAGAMLGVLLKDYFSLTETTAIIIFALMFLVVAGIPAWLMSKNLDVVYLTFLYCFSIDKEYEELGITGIPSRFKGIFSVKCEKKAGRLLDSKQKKIAAYIGTLVCLLSLVAPVFVIFTLYSRNYTITTLGVPYHDWLESMSWATGYGLIALGIGGLMVVIARRKLLSTALLISMFSGVFAIIYINYLRPMTWDPGSVQETFDIFQMIILVLELMVISPCVIGVIAEAAIIGQEVNSERKDKLLVDLEQAMLEPDIDPMSIEPS
ncbi:hypothetical protein GF325_03455 [Candidatus Bathyarchaeota archaeon]|nr:hypothetical protein [Candidatus Bathyarchaeota archaeon]